MKKEKKKKLSPEEKARLILTPEGRAKAIENKRRAFIKDSKPDNPVFGYSLVTKENMNLDGALMLAAAIVDIAKSDYISAYITGEDDYYRDTIIKHALPFVRHGVPLTHKELDKTWHEQAVHAKWRHGLRCSTCPHGKSCANKVSSDYKNFTCERGRKKRMEDISIELWMKQREEAYNGAVFNDKIAEVKFEDHKIEVVGLDRIAEALNRKVKENAEEGYNYISHAGYTFFEYIDHPDNYTDAS